MYMKIKHHSIFNNLNSDQINWNIIRNDPNEKEYFIPIEKSEYIKEASSQKSYKEIISEILFILNDFKIKTIFSLGSGRAYLEYGLKQKNISIQISDSDASMDRIKAFKIFDTVYKLSFNEVLTKVKNFKGLILMSRIDTELSDDELIEMFDSLAKNKIKHIFFIPAQLLTFRSFFIEIYLRIKSRLFKKKLVFCGYSRSKNLLIRLWGNHYTTYQTKNSKSFLLELR